MKLTRAEVEKISTLARLRLDDNEIERMTGQLEKIITYVEQLQQLDIDDVEPMAHPLTVRNVFRDDVVQVSQTREDALKNAPASHDGFFLVPPVLD